MAQGPISILDQLVQGASNKLGISTATVIKASPGRIESMIMMPTSTTATVAVYDAASTASTASTNLVFSQTSFASTTVPTIVNLNFPCANGIVVVASTASASVSYN